MLKQPSIPRERVLIKFHLAGWKAEAQKGWVTGHSQPVSQGYRSEEIPRQSDCGRKCLPPPPSAHVITTHLATPPISAQDFELMKHPHHCVSSQQSPKPHVLCLILFLPKPLDNHLHRVEAHPSKRQAPHAQHLGVDKAC